MRKVDNNQITALNKKQDKGIETAGGVVLDKAVKEVCLRCHSSRSLKALKELTHVYPGQVYSS